LKVVTFDAPNEMGTITYERQQQISRN